MPRTPRIQYPGAIYHVMARGNRRENIVQGDDAEGDDDRWMFLHTHRLRASQPRQSRNDQRWARF
jgi:hypothetical protein